MDLFLDLDGVLVDFVLGAFTKHKKFIPMNDVIWDFNEQMGLKPVEFWAPLDYDFWVNLPWTKEGKDIVQICLKVFGDGNITLLTSPPKTKGAIQGKIDWIERELPQFKRRFLIGPGKEAIAGPGKVLLDDCQVNTDAFYDNGGVSVLVPRPWNSLKHLTVNGVFDPAYLYKQLTKVYNDV
jgi:hypothetical protein